MWRVRNEATGKEQVWYEGELIEEIKKQCNYFKRIFNDEKGAVYITQFILDLINEKEGK